nr:MAG TPA: hypothetical protein [Caudoviricetes sp.]
MPESIKILYDRKKRTEQADAVDQDKRRQRQWNCGY